MVFTGLIQTVGLICWNRATSRLYLRVLPGIDRQGGATTSKTSQHTDTTCNTIDNYWGMSRKGDSVAINGVCLTLVNDPKDQLANQFAEFFVMEETLKRANLRYIFDSTDKECNEFLNYPIDSLTDSLDELAKKVSTAHYVNVEHAMRYGDSWGGHVVQGHILGVAPIVRLIKHKDESLDVWVKLLNDDRCTVPAHIVLQRNKIRHKGSIALNGTSLTVAEWNEQDGEVRVSLIPVTQQKTVFQYCKEGDLLNIELEEHDNKDTLRCEFKDTTEAKDEKDRKQYNALIDINAMDDYYMQLAITEGERGRLTAPPNPWVGCILVDPTATEIIGQGYHRKAGEAHAEIHAIRDAINRGNQNRLTGCTVYTTLEPCCHWGRTGPCTEVLIKHKVGRVVSALEDPDANVASNGFNVLRSSGIDVKVGVLQNEAEQSLRPYLQHRRSNKSRPYVVLKVATSIDGKIAYADGTSQWITNEKCRHAAHVKWRSTSQAIIVGLDTVLNDDPKLTVRHVAHELREDNFVLDNIPKPIRVVLTSGSVNKKSIPVKCNITDPTQGPSVVFSLQDPVICAAETKRLGIPVISSPAVLPCVKPDALNRDENVSSCSTNVPVIDLQFVLQHLASRGVLQILVEGGGKTVGEFLRQNIVDRLVIHTGPSIIGNTGKSWTDVVLSNSIEDSTNVKWTLRTVEQIGDSVVTEYDKEQY